MPSPSRPNVVLLVLDACRLDHAEEYAPTLQSLGEDGAWFENAIAPATWSQPSHASLFLGTYPHEHGVTQPTQSRAPVDLVERLRERGYATHGVSGNGFTSPLWAFDRAFDSFRYTQTPEPFTTGLDTYSILQTEKEGRSAPSLAGATLAACLTHDRPLRSLANLGSVGLNVLARNVATPLTRIPHGTFAPTLPDTYSPEKNTARIESVIRAEADGDDPFFVFANYMDAHRPYVPPPERQRAHLGEVLSRSELRRLNEEVAAPWEFVRLVQDDAVDDEDLRRLRGLYAGTVETVDDHVGRVLAALEEQGVREETLVVVTADHGENLGETDATGRRRFGHEASISDALARVPLVIDHPALDDADHEAYVSLKDLYALIDAVADPEVGVEGVDLADLHASQVLCEYPALGDESFHERYPEIDRSVVRHRTSVDSVAAYRDDWRIVLESDGTRFVERDGEHADPEEAPDELVDEAERVLDSMAELSRSSVSSQTASQLEDLGYL